MLFEIGRDGIVRDLMDGFPIVSCDGFAAAGSAAEEAKPAETPKNDRRLSFGIDFFF